MSRELILGDSDGFHQQDHWFEHPRMIFNKSISCIVQIIHIWKFSGGRCFVGSFFTWTLQKWCVLWKGVRWSCCLHVPGHSGVRRVGICHCLRGQPFSSRCVGTACECLWLSCFLGFSRGRSRRRKNWWKKSCTSWDRCNPGYSQEHMVLNLFRCSSLRGQTPRLQICPPLYVF